MVGGKQLAKREEVYSLKVLGGGERKRMVRFESSIEKKSKTAYQATLEKKVTVGRLQRLGRENHGYERKGMSGSKGKRRRASEVGEGDLLRRGGEPSKKGKAAYHDA